MAAVLDGRRRAVRGDRSHDALEHRAEAVAADAEGGDVELLLGELFVGFRVLGEGAVGLEPAPEAAGGGHHVGVHPDLDVRHGRRVEGAAAHEALYIEVLAARDEGLGEVALGVEREVPERGRALHAVPRIDARQRHVDDGEPVHRIPVIGRQRIGDHAADVVADDRVALVPEARHQRVHVFGHRRLVVARRRLVGVSRAPEVGCNDRARCRERRHDAPPHFRRQRPAVQQHDGIALARDHVVEANAVRRQGAVLDAGVCHGMSVSVSGRVWGSEGAGRA